MKMKRYIHVTKFNKGEMIFNKGDIGDCMYEIVYGKVGIYLHYGTPEEKLLAVKGSGEYFGEIALLEIVPRTAAAISLEDGTSLRILSQRSIHGYFDEHPEALVQIFDTMSERLQQGRQLYLKTCDTVAKYKAVVDSGQTPDEELSAEIDECLKMSERYHQKIGAGL